MTIYNNARPLVKFAVNVLCTARAHGRRFGDDKVWLADCIPGTMSVEEFSTLLSQARREGLLNLSRCDLAGEFSNLAKVSEMKLDNGAEVHLVRI